MNREMSKPSAVAAIAVALLAVILFGVYMINRPAPVGPDPGIKAEIGRIGAAKAPVSTPAMRGRIAPPDASRVFR